MGIGETGSGTSGSCVAMRTTFAGFLDGRHQLSCQPPSLAGRMLAPPAGLVQVVLAEAIIPLPRWTADFPLVCRVNGVAQNPSLRGQKGQPARLRGQTLHVWKNAALPPPNHHLDPVCSFSAIWDVKERKSTW